MANGDPLDPKPSRNHSTPQDAAERTVRVRRAVVAMATAGERITMSETARRAEVSLSWMYRNPEIKALVNQAQLNPTLVVAATAPNCGPSTDLAMIVQRIELILAQVKQEFDAQRAKLAQTKADIADLLDGQDRLDEVLAYSHEHALAMLVRLLASDVRDSDASG